MLPNYKEYQPECLPKAIILILHSFSEHAGRYENFAEYLASRGYLVASYDQRGHDRYQVTAEKGRLGKDGWSGLLKDAEAALKLLQQTYPSQKIILFGHGLGAMLAQRLASGSQRGLLGGVILSGPSYFRRWVLTLLQAILFLETWRKSGRSQFFGWLSARIGPDWRSRHQLSLHEFAREHQFTLGAKAWYEIIGGIKELHTPSRRMRLRRDVPFLVLGGKDDPLARSRKLQKLAREFVMLGVEHITLIVYPNARHDILHELGAKKTMHDIESWLETFFYRNPRA